MLLGNGNSYKETSAYDFLISAKWLDNLDPDMGVDLILDYLFDNLSGMDLRRVSRVTIVHTEDQLLKFVLGGISVSKSITVIDNCAVGNVTIPHAILFECM